MSFGGLVGEVMIVMIKDEFFIGNSIIYKDGILWSDIWIVVDIFNFGVIGIVGVGLFNILLFDGVLIMGKVGVDMILGYIYSDG